LANEVDELMNLDPLEMTPANIDSIIAYHRKNRANAALGIKPAKESGPKLKLDDLVAKMVKTEPKPAVGTIKRR